IQSLGLKKQRQQERVFLAEGPKIVAELLHLVPERFRALYAVEDWARENASLLSHLPVTTVTPGELERLSQLQAPNRVLAVLGQFESRPPDGSSFTLYLDTIQDPGNFGTIVRIADWFGIGHMVCSSGCADLYNPKVVQSTMASIARVNVHYDEEGSWLEGRKGPVYAATLGGSSLYKEPRTTEGVLIIGNESKGISPSILSSATRQLTIPRRGEAESLNAAVATGIILSHLLS
ncbi:MAG TPA: RNA methyltransferase, partial [Flavisolibacter sp.]